MEAIARPLYTAPSAAFGICDLSTAMKAWVKLTPGLHPAIVPSSVAKMKRLDPDLVPSVTMKSVGTPLKTTPVGVPPVIEPGDGMLTTSGPLGLGGNRL